MGLWFLRRLGQVLPTLLILSVLIFGLQQLMPGDPALILAGEERGDPQVLAQIRGELRLDRPIWEQYAVWLANVVQGHFRSSSSSWSCQPRWDPETRNIPPGTLRSPHL